jgi:hypothetical protein
MKKKHKPLFFYYFESEINVKNQIEIFEDDKITFLKYEILYKRIKRP